MCDKVKYGSANAAKRANSKNGQTLRVYSCPDCHKWHVTKRQGGR